METVSVKFEEEFLTDIEKTMKKHRYTTKTEFIREAIRDKIKDLEKEEALARVRSLYGKGAKKHKNLINKDIHKAREELLKELEKDKGIIDWSVKLQRASRKGRLEHLKKKGLI